MRSFNAVKNQSGIGFIVDALFGSFVYLHNLHTVIEPHTNFVEIHFDRQPYYAFYWKQKISNYEENAMQ